MKLLGISCYYHDSAACLIDSGRIVAAAQEERFTRKKHDEGFPLRAVRYCLAEGGVGPGKAALDGVVFYDKPLLKFHRIVENYLYVAPKGLRSFAMALPVWLKEKLWIPPDIHEALAKCGIEDAPQLYFTEHHESHAASAFYPSPFEEAAVLTLDGVGEWATTTVGVGEGNRLRLIREIDYPHSIGLLRMCSERPCDCRAAEQRDELAPFHSITSSARASSVGGTSRPSALAVLRLMNSSSFVA